MTSYEIQELINKAKESKKTKFLVKIENVGYIEMSKDDVIKRLYYDFQTASLHEFAIELKNSKVQQIEIAEKLGIHKVQFNQLLSGHTRKNSKIGDSIDFINKSKEIICKI